MMKHKWHSWDFWDWQSIDRSIMLVLGIIIFIVLFVEGPETCNKIKEKRYDAQATAKVVSVIKNRSAGTYEKSSTVYLDGVTIKYNFIVGTNLYDGAEIVPNYIKNRKFLSYVLNSDNASIPIKYLSNDPTKSVIALDDSTASNP